MPPTLTWLREFDGEHPTFHLVCEHTIVGRQPRELHLQISDSLPSYDCFQFRIQNTLYIGLSDGAMSRTHFAIRRAENEFGAALFWIRDLRSSSGIRINGVQNQNSDEIPLQGGEKIRAGGADLVFNLW
jgi:FHA domain